MLDAQYLWDIPDSVVAIWEELEDWAIADIIDRILKVDELNQTGIGGVARYRMELLQRMGMDMNDVLSEISQYTKKSEKELKELFLDAGTKSLENDAAVLLEHGIKTAMLSSNEWAKQILQMMYDKTNGELRNFTGTFAQSYQKVLYECLDRAFMETVTGMRSYTEAIGQAIEDLGKLGITMIDYKDNHKDTVETVVRRAVLTGVNQASMRICIENAKRLGAEYVIVSSHLGARVSEDKVSNHAGWQGKVYKIEGSDEIAPNLEEETGFPNNPLGLGGYNCRHNMFMWFPETGDENPFIQYGKAENEKAYKISQKQRAKERAIRKRKRELMALQKGIESTDNEELKFELQQRYDKSAQKLQLQNKNYNEFCEENDVKTQYERMKLAKWDRTQARQASAGAQRYRNSLLTDESDIANKLKKKMNRTKDKLTDLDIPLRYSELPEEFRAEAEKTMAAAPEWIRRIYDDNVDKFEFKNIKATTGRRSADGIRIDINKSLKDNRGGLTSYFHEIGHEIDHILGLKSENLEFGKKLRSDYGKLVELMKLEYNIDEEGVFDIFRKNLKGFKAHSIRDIINGINKRNIFKTKSNHDESYWKKPYKLEHEAFAHMFEAIIRSDEQKLHYLSTMFPSAYEEFLKLMGELER